MLEGRKQKATTNNTSMVEHKQRPTRSVRDFEPITNPSPNKDNAHFIAEFADEKLPLSVLHR